jgi:Ni,Fe-hydrogenase III small subunit
MTGGDAFEIAQILRNMPQKRIVIAYDAVGGNGNYDAYHGIAN